LCYLERNLALRMRKPLSTETIIFGPFQVLPRTAELYKHGVRLKLSGQPFAILTMLLDRPGELITREEIRERLWPVDTFVDFEHSLNSAVKKLRQALGDSADEPRYVETLPRLGYRFIGEISPAAVSTESPSTDVARSSEEISAGTPPSPLPVPIAQESNKHFREWAAIAVVTMAIIGAIVFSKLSGHTRASLNDTDWVLVSDFVNTTGDPIFDGSLKQATTVKLSESPYFNVMLDSKIRQTLQLMNRSPQERVVPPISREVCQRAGAKVAVSGSIVAVGNKFAVGLDAQNCHTGASLAHIAMPPQSRDQVLKTLGEVVAELRRSLGESLATLTKFDTPIEQATTPSLAALKAYTEGDGMRAQGKEAESVPYYKMAVDLDPEFAIAYARLGAVSSNLQEVSNQAKYLQLAFDRRGHISEREKFYIAAHYYVDVRGEFPKAIETYKLWTQTYVHDWVPFNNLSNEYVRIGDPQNAISAGQVALRLNPYHSLPYAALAEAYVRASRFPEAKAICERAMAEKLDGPMIHRILYEVADAENDDRAMQRQVEWFADKPIKTQILDRQALSLMRSGEVRKARELFRLAADAALQQGLKGYADAAFIDLAEAEAYLGNSREALADLARSIALSPENKNGPDAAIIMAFIGDFNRAEAIVKKLSTPPVPVTTAVRLAAARAIDDLNHGNPKAAVEDMRAVVPYDLSDDNGGLTFYCRGLAYLKLGAAKEAAAEFQKVLDNPGVTELTMFWPLSQLGLARAYASQQEIAKSVTAYRQFLASWKNADPDLTVLKQAKKEFAKLETHHPTP
jgi:eukaryotic-like serine/threonine-protein kinase